MPDLAKKLTRIALVFALALVCADGALSLFVIRDGLFFDRPLPPFGALTHPKQRETLARMGEDPHGPWVFDRELGWCWKPSTHSEDGLISINALGARGPHEYGPEPAAGRTRVLTFGDSFTFCDEVGDEAAFENQMEQRAPDFEVLNFGVSGYGTDQSLLRFRRTGRMGAEVVCIGILLENIGRNVNRYRPLWATRTGVCMTKPRFVLGAAGELELVPQPFDSREELRAALEDGSVIERVALHEYWLGRPGVPTGTLSSLVRIAAGYLAYRERTPARLWLAPEAEPFQVTLAILERFHREALAAGAHLAPVLVFPARDDLVRYALEDRPYWGALTRELERRGIPFLDLSQVLSAAARSSTDDPTGRRLYQGGHLSRQGNALVAAHVLEWIAAQPASRPATIPRR